jgi:hypothetical protein
MGIMTCIHAARLIVGIMPWIHAPRLVVGIMIRIHTARLVVGIMTQIHAARLVVWNQRTLTLGQQGHRNNIWLCNATFNNISFMSWWSVLLLDETGLPEKYQWSAARFIFASFIIYSRIKENMTSMFELTTGMVNNELNNHRIIKT